MKVAIVGAGMAGLAAAEALVAAGFAVTLFDKGSRPGGRMATRRVETALGEAGFDHGAQYFTARDDAFAARVARWRDSGLVVPWPAAGPDAFVGTPTMSTLVQDVASRLDVRWSSRIASLSLSLSGVGWICEGEDGGRSEVFDAAIVAIPAEQAGALVAPHDAGMAEAAATARAAPCWTVMASFAERVSTDHDIITDAGPIAWAARNSSKPGRSGPEAWVMQAGAEWSIEHLEQSPDAAGAVLLGAFAGHIGAQLPQLLASAAHRWRFARYEKGGGAPLWRPDIGLGLCGDWLIGPRVECAWLSGHLLARAISAATDRA